MNNKYNFWREISYLHNAIKKNQQRSRGLYEATKLQRLLPSEPFCEIEELLKRSNNILNNYRSNRANFIFGENGVLEEIIGGESYLSKEDNKVGGKDETEKKIGRKRSLKIISEKQIKKFRSL